jgi:hypothetical protein
LAKSISITTAFRLKIDKPGDSLGKLKALEYTCGLGVMIVGLGLYSYYVRELLASLLLFSVAFFSMSLVILSVFLAWCASKQVALWSQPTSRNAIALALVEGPDLLAIGAKEKT